MSCLNASVSRVGESITASVVTNNGINVAVERYGRDVSAIARVLNKAVEATASLCSKIITPIVTRIGDPMVASCNMVCSIGMDNGREVFMVKEGVFLLADGDTFKVIKSYELQ